MEASDAVPITSNLPVTTEEDVHTETEGTEVAGGEETETTMATVTAFTPSNLGISATLIGVAAGGVVGLLIVLMLFLFVLALVWTTRKNKKTVSKAKENQQQMQLEESDWIKTVCVQQQQQGDLQVESNCAYDTFARQIPTVESVAYGQIQSDCNFLSDHACSDYEYI